MLLFDYPNHYATQPQIRDPCVPGAVTAEGARKCLLSKPVSDRQRDTRTFLFHRCLICSVVRQGTGPVKFPLSFRGGLASEFIQIKEETKSAGSTNLITEPFIFWSLIICAIKDCVPF